MTKSICILFFLFFTQISIGQVLRVAILDFENLSGIAKYDGLGKAMSSMLISDIEVNVSSKRLQLVERAQINKIMKEQNLQKSASFDKSTSVKMGKLLGANFILIGDIYILDNNLVINARLADASSGEIKFSEKQEGKINEWLSVKTKLGKGIATNLSMPFTQPRIPDALVSPALLTTYAGAIEEKDKGNFEKAETLISTAKDFDPAFGYLDDLRDDVDKLKKQVTEQGKKIEILEKSGGRIVDARTYSEFKFNLTNQLTSYEDKIKIFAQIMNSYPVDWEKENENDRESLFYSLFSKQYNFSSFDLSQINLLLNDILKSRELIKKENLQVFDKSIYKLLQKYLLYAYKKIYFLHEFSNNDYLEFKRLANIIVKSVFNTSNEQLYALFSIMSQFNYEKNELINQDVKKDIVATHKQIYELLNFSYGPQIIEQVQNSNNDENDELDLYISSKLKASEQIIIFLSAKRNDYRSVIKQYVPFSLIETENNTYNYVFENNEKNRSDNDDFLVELKKIFYWFSIPSFDNNDPYLTVSSNTYLIELPIFIPLNEVAKRAIIQLDSTSHRYTRIANSLKEQNITDPCLINEQAKWFIKQSDSLAIIKFIYVFTNKFEIGSRIQLIYNANKDTTYAYVVGQKISKTTKEFEIVENKFLKNLNVNQPIKYIREFYSEDLQANEIDISNQKDFEKSKSACEAIKKQEADRLAREAYFKKQEEERRKKVEEKKLAYDNKLNTAISLFVKKSISADTELFYELINLVIYNEIKLDSLFNLSYSLLIGDNKNILSNRKSSPPKDIPLSILLNIYFIEEISNRNIHPVIKQNIKNAAIINLAHGYLHASIKHGINAFDLAYQEYNSVPTNFEFDKSFNSYTRNSMIAADWNDFIFKGLVTKSQLDEFNKKYNILDQF